MKYAVVKTGGKQYLVKENDEIIVDRLNVEPTFAKASNSAKTTLDKSAGKEGKIIGLETLALFNEDGSALKLGKPALEKKTQAEIIAHIKGDKIRVARFKAKVRYRKVKGFRAQLTKIKIMKI